MNNTWVKLYRKIGDNEIMYDDKACRVFLWLLVHVDKRKGSLTTGRFQIARELKMNSNTVYKVLSRLEKKYEIVTQSSNNHFTTISLINWAKYNPYKEIVTQSSNNQVTTDEQPSNTIQDIKTKDIKTITNVINKYGHLEINEASEYFLGIMKIPKEDCAQKQSRYYWHSIIKEMGLENTKKLIDLASKDDFYKNNITSSKDLYYKRVKLITRKRGDKPKIAVMRKEDYVAADNRHESLLVKQ